MTFEDQLLAMRPRVGNVILPDSPLDGEVIIGTIIETPADMWPEVYVRWVSSQRGVFECFEQPSDFRVVQ